MTDIQQSLVGLGLRVEESMTTPTRPGKAPRPVWLVHGNTAGFEGLFRELGGRKWRGSWSFWENPTDDILSRADERMSVAEAEEYKANRKLDKADRYEGYADNAASRSEAAYERSRQICDRIPFGQPILVGHHSERGARADQRRIDAAMRKSVNEGEKASYFEGQVSNLRRDATAPRSARFMGNRIKEATAEIRKLKATMEGRYYVHGDVVFTPSEEHLATLRARLDRAEQKLAHWEGEYAKIAATRPLATPTAIRKGMMVYMRWSNVGYVVERVNAKSVSVRDYWSDEQRQRGEFHIMRIQYHQISRIVEAATPQ